MENQPTSDVINRGKFLRELGLSSSALMAFYCLGTLSSCSSSDPQPATPTPAPPTGGTTGLTGNATIAQGKINFTLDLTNATYATLKTEGNFVTVGDVIVANAKGGKLIALSKACTHQNVTVEYQLVADNFYCPPASGGHGSRYNDDGSVKNGPAAGALKKYTPTLSANGNSLVIAE